MSMCPGPQCRRAGGVKAGSRGRAVPRDRPRSAHPSLPGQPTRPAPQVPVSGARHQPFTLPGGKVFSRHYSIDPLMTCNLLFLKKRLHLEFCHMVLANNRTCGNVCG